MIKYIRILAQYAGNVITTLIIADWEKKKTKKKCIYDN